MRKVSTFFWAIQHELREDLPGIGVRKLLKMLYYKLEEHKIKMGRDKLFSLLGFHGLLVKRRIRSVRTTQSAHWLKKYPNLIKQLVVECPNRLWVSDITYIRTAEGFSYLSLLTDAYSRKLVGHCLHDSLEAAGCMETLEMALDSLPDKRRPADLIHHSDRGVQYCSEKYVGLLAEAGIAISMTQSGNPYDNALAERVNGTIKNEFFPNKLYLNHREAKKAIDKIVMAYNQKRPHLSIDYLTPDQAHLMEGKLSKRWKVYKKYAKPSVLEPVSGWEDQ
ncbi:IS3 family transposase [Algoriphagus resistens]|uniref:IS3 family transposase n=1 Tax=Algoriphagus resistens TaxID=1750590 RepID=UPI001E29D478|nr:IS3 family transposase [Algoriphagus resistens]